MSGSTDEDDEIKRQYNEWLDEENDQGPIFGHRTMYYDRGRNMCATEPSSCETCQDGRMEWAWVNYNYRSCTTCRTIVMSQVWLFMLGAFNEQIANTIWHYLEEYPCWHIPNFEQVKPRSMKTKGGKEYYNVDYGEYFARWDYRLCPPLITVFERREA